MIKWALLLVSIMLVAVQAQAKETDNDLNERSPYIQPEKNPAGKARHLKKEKEEELSNINLDFKKDFLSIKESLMKKPLPTTDIPKKTTPVYIKQKNVDFKNYPTRDFPKKPTSRYPTTDIPQEPTMVEKKVREESEEGKEVPFSARAMRKRASQKIPKKLSLLSKGLRALKVPCEDPAEMIIMEPGETVKFKSPKYPKKYPNNHYCGWHLMGANWDTRFIINCKKFKVQKRDNDGYCPDYLSLEGEDFCGKDGPDNWLSYDMYQDVIFWFYSNPKKRFKGFSCTATAYTRPGMSTYYPYSTWNPWYTTYPWQSTY